MAKIFIYGSCVTRDPFEMVKDQHELTAFVARQSLISAMGRATKLLSGPALDSKFQDRMVRGDLASNLPQTIRRYSKEADIIIMDLTDERLGVHKLPDGAFVTHSSELEKSGRLNSLSPIPGVIWPGTDRHWLFWENAAERFVELLKETGAIGKTKLIHAPWATHTTSGQPAHESERYPTLKFNAIMDQFADKLRSLGVNVVVLPSEIRKAGETHQWGVAPFHFDETATKWIAEQMMPA